MDKLFFNVIFMALLTKTSSEYGDRIKNATITWGDNLEMEESRHYGYAIAPAAPATELPITFQAPYVNARDYWTEQPRRTVFDYQSYVPQNFIQKPINTLYGFMNHFFGTDEPQRRPPPYRYHDYPKPYYIPAPKPLRASVTKLEHSTPQTYPHFVKILNNVLTENKPEPVLEKPDYHTNHLNNPKTAQPQSIQDKLPPIRDGQNVHIPYVTETTTHKTKQTTYGNRIKFPSETEPSIPLDYEIDVRNAATSTADPIIEVETLTTLIKTKRFKPEKLVMDEEASTTELTSSTIQPQPSEIHPVELIKTMESIESTRFKSPSPKKLHSRKVTTDATQTDYVSDLTLKSLTDPKTVHANVRYPMPLNMSSVIHYVIGQYNATVSKFDDSLDAKILKDTNWDGYQPAIPTTTEPITTTEPTTTFSPPTTEEPATTTTTTTTTAPDDSEAVVIATRITKTVSKSRKRITTTEEPIATPREDEITIETITTAKPARRGRKYQRRARVDNFTQNPDKKPVRLGGSSRLFPKRTTPNITLTFGNKSLKRIAKT